MEIIALPAFRDNFIWVLRRGEHIAVVDPGEAGPVLHYLDGHNLKLSALLLTHHHDDHIGGTAELLAYHAQHQGGELAVYGGLNEGISWVNRPLQEGDRVELPEQNQMLDFISVPGHTPGHGAYYGANALFCGDTLFACGCGRLFGGTPAQMHASLNRIAALPAETLIYCAHEYTQANIRFALAVEPGNAALAARSLEVNAKRERNEYTVPSTLAEELATNPFLRCSEPEVIAAASRYAGRTLTEPVEVFTALRAWKNSF